MMFSLKLFCFFLLVSSSYVRTETLEQNLLKYYNTLYREFEKGEILEYRNEALKADCECMKKSLKIDNLPNDPKEFDESALEVSPDKRFEIFRASLQICVQYEINDEFQSKITKEVNPKYAEKLKCFKQALSEIEPASPLLDNFHGNLDIKKDCETFLDAVISKNELWINVAHEMHKNIYNLTICSPEEFIPFDHSRLLFLRFAIMANDNFSDEVLKTQQEIWVNEMKKFAQIQIECFMRELRNEFKN